MSKIKRNTLGDHWNIILPEAATADELRACVYYEYARESELLVREVTEHRHSLANADHIKASEFIGLTHLDNIEAFSMPLANMVRAMGGRASLDKPWRELPEKLKTKIIASCSTSVRLASTNELKAAYCWPFEHDAPDSNTIFHNEPKSNKDDLQSPLRLLCFVIDTRATAAQIRKGIDQLFNKNIAPLIGGLSGRGASGKQTLRKALSDLAVLRLLSTREPTVARTVADHAGMSDLLRPKKRKHTKDLANSYRYDRIKAAKRTFRLLFPGLFLGEQTGEPMPMISAEAYHTHRSRGRWPKRQASQRLG